MTTVPRCYREPEIGDHVEERKLELQDLYCPARYARWDGYPDLCREMVKWLEYCKSCRRKHLVTMRPCPTCNTYETPQPVSDNVANQCKADYSCDGCIAYREHTNPY